MKNFLLAPIPCVPYRVPYPEAKWFGKFSANIGVESVKQLGGPWDTLEQACSALLSTGLYKLRPGTEAMPHFDRV